MQKSSMTFWRKFLSRADPFLHYSPARPLVYWIAAAGLLAPLAQVAGLLAWWPLLVALMVIGACLYDARNLPQKSAVSAKRTLQRLEEGEITSIRIQVTIHWKARQEMARGTACRIEVRDDLPDLLKEMEDSLAISTPSTSRTDLDYVVQALPQRRGTATFGAIHVRITGPLGLLRKQYKIPNQTTVQIWPSTRMTPAKREALQQALQQEGSIVKHTGAGQSEFSHIRDFVQGDDPRSVNWFASARTGRILRNVYQPESGQHILLALDCGRSMGVEQLKGKSRLDLAIEAAILTATAAFLNGDEVSLLALADTVQLHLPGLRGKTGLRTLTEALGALQPAPVFTGTHLLSERVFRFHKRRSLLLFFSDLTELTHQDVFARDLSILERKHACVVASFTDEALEQAACRPIRRLADARTAAAAAALLLKRSTAREQLRMRNISTIEAREELFTEALRQYVRFKNARFTARIL